MRLARVTTPSARRLTRRPALALVIGGLLIGARAMAAGCGRGSKPATAGVRGRVVSANGRALAGAKLRLIPPARSAAIATAASAADGSFALAGVAPGRYMLRGELAGFSTASIPLALQPGDGVTTVLRLEPVQLLEGLVQDGQGRPLAQAALFAWPLGGAR